MADLFNCLDLDGVAVSCAQTRWTSHIISDHPELANCEEHVERAITNPLEVRQDPLHSDRKLYYGVTNRAPGRVSLAFIRVVVQYGHQGHVVTAFMCSKIREGDALLWSSSHQQT